MVGLSTPKLQTILHGIFLYISAPGGTSHFSVKATAQTDPERICSFRAKVTRNAQG